MERYLTENFIIIALSGLLMLCLLALAAWVSYVVISSLFVWPPPLPTYPRTRRRMIEAIRKLRPAGATGGLILDPGCGFGGLVLALARAFPEGEVVGLDLQPLPLLVARLRAKLLGLRNVTFRRGDLFKEDYRGVQVIACFLWGNVMEQLYAKWDAELQDGCVVVSNLHPMPHWPPVEVIPVTEWAFVTFVTRAIYAYRLPEARTRGQAGATLRAAGGARKEPSNLMQLRPQLGAKLIKDSAFGRIAKGSGEMNIAVETHAPSQPVLVVGVLVAMLAIFLYFLPGAGNENGAFWLMAFAYVVSSLGTLVRT